MKNRGRPKMRLKITAEETKNRTLNTGGCGTRCKKSRSRLEGGATKGGTCDRVRSVISRKKRRYRLE
jgi:hypothetical protein